MPSIIDDVRAGNHVHDWHEMTVGGICLRVSRRPLTVNGVYRSMTPIQAQQIADMLGASLPVATVLDARYEQAKTKLLPIPLDVVKDTDVTHSNHVKLRLKNVPEDDLVADIGKHWVLHRNVTTARPALYGWHTGSDDHIWRGIATRPSESPETSSRVIQGVSTAHNYQHTDYSMTGVFMQVDGDLNRFEPVSYKRYPVPILSDLPPLGYVPWNDSGLTLGERALAWCMNEFRKGVREEPLGSNTSKEIREYFRPAKRDGRLLGLVKGNWCMVAQCAAELNARLSEENLVLPYVVAVIEAQQHAQQSGIWRSLRSVLDGAWQFDVGDLCVLHRGPPGSWMRHVCRVAEWADDYVVTIGGNENNRWSLTHRKLESPILGFIEYPDFERVLPSEHLASYIETSDAVMRGEVGLEYALAELEKSGEVT